MRLLFDFAFVGEKALLQFATFTQVASDELRRRCGTEIVTVTVTATLPLQLLLATLLLLLSCKYLY